MTPQLAAKDRAMLAGDEGPAASVAMEIVLHSARMTGATALLDISNAHIDGCLYHGMASIEFAELLSAGGGTVRVPTTLNVSSLDLLHPDLYRGDDQTRSEARRLMDVYVDLGCEPTWTCAPYQLPSRPGFGEHIAWAESNAVVFANSVLGARTGRYGDFFDIAAAITGRVPAAGLHLDENRAGTTVVDVGRLPPTLLETDAFYPVLGHLLGKNVSGIPALVGIPPSVTEDRLKAVGAAAASSGDLAMFHVVAVTPEAPTLESALGGRGSRKELLVTAEMVTTARKELSTTGDDSLGAVSLGTPHYSATELRRLVDILDGRRISDRIDCFVSTSRDTLGEIEADRLDIHLSDAGIELVVDTCTYVTPILRDVDGAVMTDSAKWAYYAPGNLGVDVVFGSVEDCVESAVAGEIRRDEGIWRYG
ncbi:MAG: DUF521 domain-containing protein [Acidimicrobiia bacterium]|nr:DUF521 domain-containing protein [Acidimicrobiia bacterium]